MNKVNHKTGVLINYVIECVYIKFNLILNYSGVLSNHLSRD